MTFVNGKRVSIEEEKKIAVEMWEFVRTTMVDMDAKCNLEYIKESFIRMKERLGVKIEWQENCILCNYCDSCLVCPLFRNSGDQPCGGSEERDRLPPYSIVAGHGMTDENGKTTEYAYSTINESIDTIIESIKEFDL